MYWLNKKPSKENNIPAVAHRLAEQPVAERRQAGLLAVG